MPWNNNGPNPWGSSGGSSSGGGDQGGGPSGGGDGQEPPPRGPWGGGGQGGGPRGPGGGSGGGPGGPFGGGGGPIPDLDRLIRMVQHFLRNLLPGGGSGAGIGGLWLLVAGVAVLWLASGFYRVQPDEQGIVLRFGAYLGVTNPGLQWHIPWPVESVRLPAVTRVNRIEIGYRSAAGGGNVQYGQDATGRELLNESLMLTGDENIIDIDVAVFWRVRANEASKFLFNAAAPEDLVRGVAESSMREVIGRTQIQPALTGARAQIEADVLKQTQEILDRYNVGIEITEVALQNVDTPAEVRESFRDVQRATTDAERMRNEAEAYHNDIVPRARGAAAQVLAEAQGAKLASVAEATGQAQRFDSVLQTYRQAKEITLRRMYIDAMQNALSHSSTLIVDDNLKGLVPFLPLNSPPAPAKPPPPAPPAQPTIGGTPR